MNKSKASQEDPAVLLNKKRSSLIVGKPAAGCVVTRTSASQLSSRSSSASSLFSPGTLLRQPQQLIGDSIDEDDLDMHIFKSPSAFQAQLFKGQILFPVLCRSIPCGIRDLPIRCLHTGRWGQTLPCPPKLLSANAIQKIPMEYILKVFKWVYTMA